jgi:hypothetical protein
MMWGSTGKRTTFPTYCSWSRPLQRRVLAEPANGMDPIKPRQHGKPQLSACKAPG